MAASQKSTLLQLSIKINENVNVNLMLDQFLFQQLSTDRRKSLLYLKELIVDGSLQEDLLPYIEEALGNSQQETTETINQETTENEPIENNNSGSSNYQPVFHWNNKATLLLISLVAELYERLQKGKKKRVWLTIAERMADEHDITVSWEQCDSKWKALKSTYKKIYDHNSTSGNNRKDWEYFNAMNDILRGRPEVQPVATLNSRSGQLHLTQQDCSRAPSPASSSGSSASPMTAMTAMTDPDGPSPSMAEKRPRVKRKSFHERLEETANNRHKEKMQRQDRFLSLMEKLIDKL